MRTIPLSKKMQYWNGVLCVLCGHFISVVKAANDCQPSTWKRDVGDIVCRYTATSPDVVNYYTCTQLALQYERTVEDFFFLNPTMDRDCATMKPNTEYCVRGCKVPAFLSPFSFQDILGIW